MFLNLNEKLSQNVSGSFVAKTVQTFVYFTFTELNLVLNHFVKETHPPQIQKAQFR